MTFDIPNTIVHNGSIGISVNLKLGKIKYRVSLDDPSITGFREATANAS